MKLLPWLALVFCLFVGTGITALVLAVLLLDADLSDIRDGIIIVFGVVAVLTLLVTILFTVAIGISAFVLLRVTRRTMQEGVSPLLENAQAAARNVRGTTEFVSDAVVSPLIGVYGFFAGVRHGLGTLINLGRR